MRLGKLTEVPPRSDRKMAYTLAIVIKDYIELLSIFLAQIARMYRAGINLSKNTPEHQMPQQGIFIFFFCVCVCVSVLRLDLYYLQ